MVTISKQSPHPCERLRHQAKKDNLEEEFVKKTPQNPRVRVKKVTKKLEFDINMVTEIIWWQWNVFVAWLSNKRCLVLFPDRTIFRDIHHLDSPRRRKQDLNLHRT